MKSTFRNTLVKATILSMLPLAAQAAVTYTNNFGAGDPALVFVENDQNYQAWDISEPTGIDPVPRKNWDVLPTLDSIAVSGWATVPEDFANENPGAAGRGGSRFRASTTLNSLPGFKISELTQVSYRISLGENHTASTFLNVSLVTSTGEIYQLQPGLRSTAVITRSGPDNTGDYIRTYSNFTEDPNDNTYVGLMFENGFNGTFVPGEGMIFDRGQFVDATFQSTSVSIIPEPSGALLGLVGAGLLLRRRRLS